VAVSSSGEIYISDGYGNARVHKFAPDGKYLLSWGEPGYAPGQFRLPHHVWVDKQNRVWVVDRENSRIQIFDAKGKFLEQWEDVFRPTGVCLDEDGVVYVSELCLRVSIFTPKGRLLARWGTEAKQKLEDALFVAPHAIAIDSRGDLYVGDVAWTHNKTDRGPRVIQKFARRSR
jgi:streptogramin lyase